MLFLTAEQVSGLADAMDPRYRALVLVAAYGGLRIGEATALRRSIAEELAAHLEKWAGPELVFPAPGGGPIRLGQWRQRFWAPAVARAGLPHTFARSRKAIGCSWCGLEGDAPNHQRPLRIHDLRHSAVALWIANGASPKEIAARAGHTSVVTVLDRYGHLYEDADERLIERLELVFRAAATGPGRDGDGTSVLPLLPRLAENRA
jgi:integrase